MPRSSSSSRSGAPPETGGAARARHRPRASRRRRRSARAAPANRVERFELRKLREQRALRRRDVGRRLGEFENELPKSSRAREARRTRAVLISRAHPPSRAFDSQAPCRSKRVQCTVALRRDRPLGRRARNPLARFAVDELERRAAPRPPNSVADGLPQLEDDYSLRRPRSSKPTPASASAGVREPLQRRRLAHWMRAPATT